MSILRGVQDFLESPSNLAESPYNHDGSTNDRIIRYVKGEWPMSLSNAFILYYLQSIYPDEEL